MSTRLQTQAKATPTPSFTPTRSGLLQRKCACGGSPGLTGECEECRKKRLTSQRRSDNQAEPSTLPSIVQEVLQSPGQPLDSATRAFMEPRLGHDFSRVRVHTDARAVESARAVSARAYTVGSDVVFAEGQFEPGAEQGRKLLAHELTHTIQQSSFAPTVHPQHPISSEPAGTPLERTAEENASRLASSPGGLAPSPRIALQRAPAPPGEIEMPAEYVGELEMPTEYVGKLPVAEASEQRRIKWRRQRTIKFFNKIKDDQLESAYIGRLQRYLNEGLEANDSWDVEMIEQIIKERAPNAPWHEKARQDFLAQLQVKLQTQLQAQEKQKYLLTLPAYWQNQMGALSEQTQGWPEELRALAQDLLLKWFEFRNEPLIERSIREDVASQYEHVLRAVDQAIQEECRHKRPQTEGFYAIARNLEKTYGDPCKPWFDTGTGTRHIHGRAEYLLTRFKQKLYFRTDEDGSPYRSVVFWLEEYLKQSRLVPNSMDAVHLDLLSPLASAIGLMTGFPGKPVPPVTANKTVVPPRVALTHPPTPPTPAQAANAPTQAANVTARPSTPIPKTSGLDEAAAAKTGSGSSGGPSAPSVPDANVAPPPAPPVSPVRGPTPTTTTPQGTPPTTTAPSNRGRTRMVRPSGGQAKYRRPPSTKSKETRGAGGRPASSGAKALRGGKRTTIPQKKRGGKTGSGPHAPAPAPPVVSKQTPAQTAPTVAPSRPATAAPAATSATKAKRTPQPPAKQKAPTQPKSPKPLKPPKAPKADATKTPQKPKRSTPKRTMAQKDPKYSDNLDERIARVRKEVGEANQRTVEYKAARVAAGENEKGGASKIIWNKKEELHVLERARAYPDRTILEQVQFVGIKGADGKITPAAKIAGKGRTVDFLEEHGGKWLGGEAKSKSEIVHSVEDLHGPNMVGDFKKTTSKVGIQRGKEQAIIDEATTRGGKLVFKGKDVRTGKTVDREIDPKDYRLTVVDYDQIRPN